MNTDLFDKVMNIYIPQCRYLKNVEMQSSKAIGQFQLSDTIYTLNKIHHMTSIEAQLCLNQLMFYAFGEWLSKGVQNYQIPLEQYVSMMESGMFILNSEIGFKNPIENTNSLVGTIELQRCKKIGTTFFSFLKYDIEQGKSFGNMKLALTTKTPL